MWLLLAVTLHTSTPVMEFESLKQCSEVARQLNLASECGNVVFLCSYKELK